MLHKVVCTVLFVFFITVSVESAPVGLVNKANACFANSMMQALFHIPSFRRAVSESSSEAAPNQKLHRELVTAFQKLSLKAHDPESLYDLYNALLVEANIDVRVASDGATFMICLLQKALPPHIFQNLFALRIKREYIINGYVYPLSEIQDPSPLVDFEYDKESWSTNFLRNLKHHFLNITRNISPRLKRLIDAHRQANVLQPVDWSKTVRQKVERFPNKIVAVTMYPTESSDKAYIDRSTVPLTIVLKGKPYHLISAVIWHGTQQGGHYWAIAKTDTVNNVWYKLNDRRVNRIREDQVMEELKLCNTLFYVQEDEINQNRLPLHGLDTNPISPVVAKSNIPHTTSNTAPIPSTPVPANTDTPSPSPNTTSQTVPTPSTPDPTITYTLPANNSPSTSYSPSSSSSGGGGGGSSSSGSSRPSSSDSTSGSSRTAPSPASTQSKTAAAKAIPIASMPLYKRPVFWVGTLGAVITVGVVATLVVMRSSS